MGATAVNGSRVIRVVMENNLAVLRGMFPEADEGSLRAVLDMTGGDVTSAAGFLLGDGGDAAAGADAAAAAFVEGVGEDGEGEEEEEEEEDEDEEDEGEGEGEVQGAPTLPQPPAKRLRKVEPTEPTKLAAAGKSNLARFDTLMLRKTYLDLLNIMPSKLDHNSVTLWRDDVTDEAGALAMLSGEEGGWWVHHFPAAELDHVWRSLVNKHTQNKTLGQVVSLHAPSFAPEADGEVEVRVLVSPQQMAPTELKKAGAALLAVAPSSHNKPHVYFVRGPLGECFPSNLARA